MDELDDGLMEFDIKRCLQPDLKPMQQDDASKTKDVGVQAKISTFISLQRKVATLSTCTQTPNLETDDTYEAAVLRGGPLNGSQVGACVSQPNILRFYLNTSQPQCSPEGSLSSRFHQLSQADQGDCPLGVYVVFYRLVCKIYATLYINF